MFSFGWTWADARRAIWAFIFGAVTYLLLTAGNLVEEGNDWTAADFWLPLLSGAVMAGLSAIKNAALADDSKLK